MHLTRVGEQEKAQECGHTAALLGREDEVGYRHSLGWILDVAACHMGLQAGKMENRCVEV